MLRARRATPGPCSRLRRSSSPPNWGLVPGIGRVIPGGQHELCRPPSAGDSPPPCRRNKRRMPTGFALETLNCGRPSVPAGGRCAPKPGASTTPHHAAGWCHPDAERRYRTARVGTRTDEQTDIWRAGAGSATLLSPTWSIDKRLPEGLTRMTGARPSGFPRKATRGSCTFCRSADGELLVVKPVT